MVGSYWPHEMIFTLVLASSMFHSTKRYIPDFYFSFTYIPTAPTLHDLGEDLFLVGAAKPPTKRKDLPQVYVKVKSICMSR